MKLIINNQEFEITQKQAQEIKEAYEDDASIFPVNGNIFFRGSITNSYILNEEKSQEKELKKIEREVKPLLENYNKFVTADDKRRIREENPSLDKYLKSKKQSCQNLK